MNLKNQGNDKLIIFDWGGVVESHLTGEYNCFTHEKDVIYKLSGEVYDEKTIAEKWKNCNLDENRVSIMETDSDSFIANWFLRIKKEFHLDCTFEEFENVYYEYGNKVYYYKDVVQFIHSLKGKCKIGILSNLSRLDYSRIDAQYDLSKFDYVWLSYLLNCKKPKEKIYEMVEKESGFPPDHILFIDDVSDNILIPQQRGWNVLLATGHELDKIKEKVQEFLEK